MMVRGDFGGINVDSGDFVTPGTSGLPMGSMGFSLNDVFSSVFGTGAEAVKQSLQQAGTTAAMNVAGKVVQQNPDAVRAAQEALASTQKSTMEQLWIDYKTPIIIGGVLLTALVTIGSYNTYMKR